MSNIKKYSFYSFLFLMFFVLWNSRLIIYGYAQLKGQVNILAESKNIEYVLKDPNFPDSLKIKLKLVQEIKRFAIDSIGLNKSDAYESVFNQKGLPTLNIITACKPYELEDYTWTFPLLGEVSYKGFFDTTMLRKEALSIKGKKYDINIGEVTAWSTLGWFKDPILTNFLRRNEGMLSNLIIHELTHGTIYVKSDVYFNENLASFIGHEGAKAFLESKFGKNDSIYIKYIQEMKDEKTLTDFVVMKSNQLDSLYQTFDPQMAAPYKEEIKREYMSSFLTEFNKLPIRNIELYLPKIEKLNNTYFQSFRRYNSNMDYFENEFKKFKNIPSYIEYVKSTYK